MHIFFQRQRLKRKMKYRHLRHACIRGPSIMGYQIVSLADAYCSIVDDGNETHARSVVLIDHTKRRQVEI